MKECKTCGDEIDLDEYPKRGSGRRANCKGCTNARARELYHGNEEKRKRRIKKVRINTVNCRRRIKERIDKLKQHPCSKCGGSYPPTVMEFHHQDPTEKEINISNAVAAGWSMERLLREIAKCTLLCANCHRMIHLPVSSLEAKAQS